MTRRATKWVLAIFILLSSLAYHYPAWARSKKAYTFPQQETILPAPGDLISVQSTQGDIRIIGGDRQQVIIQATKRVKARTREEAEEWAQKVNIIIDEREKVLFIGTQKPREWSGSLSDFLSNLLEKKPSVRVDFEILAPREMNIQTVSVSGDIYIAGINGQVEVDVVSGDVELEEIGGNVSVDAVSGDMFFQDIRGGLEIDAVSGNTEMADIRGDINIDITSGDVSGKRIEGKLTVNATSGDVSIKPIHGDINIDVTSGDVTICQKSGDLWIDTSSGDVLVETIVEKACRYEVDTSSGEIMLRIPETSSSTVDLETSGGRIHVKLPIIVESVSRTHLRGTLGSGAAEIVLSTSGGDIDLLPLD